jgi:hypothetical protein
MPVKIEDLLLAASQAIQFEMARRDFDYVPFYFVTSYRLKRSANAGVKFLRNYGFRARLLETQVGHKGKIAVFSLYVAKPAEKRKRKKYLLPSERNRK